MAEWATGDVITAARLNACAFVPGDVKLTARITPPSGWLLCDGAAVSRTTYDDLFTAIGTSYGVGDGSTTFNVPNFLGRAVLGAGSGSGLTARAKGDKAGAETHTLVTAELASHNHSHTHNGIANHTHNISFRTDAGAVTAPKFATDAGNSSSGWGSVAGGGHTHSADATAAGSESAHNNMQPFGVATYIIKI